MPVRRAALDSMPDSLLQALQESVQRAPEERAELRLRVREPAAPVQREVAVDEGPQVDRDLPEVILPQRPREHGLGHGVPDAAENRGSPVAEVRREAPDVGPVL